MTKRHKKQQVAVKKKTDGNVEILGAVISGTRRDQVLRTIALQREKMLHIATVNPEFVMEARVNERFDNSLKKSLTVADGHGIAWAGRILKSQRATSRMGNIERISGARLAEWMVEDAAKKGKKVFLLGAAEGVAEKAASFLRTKYPQLQVSWYSGAQTVRVEKSEEASMTIAKINAYEPDYLLVAYSAPWSVMWIEENRPYLRVRVAMGVGGVFDEWAGVVPLCPAWMDQRGLKWLFRLITQPWRYKRVLRVIQFGFLVILTRLKRVF